MLSFALILTDLRIFSLNIKPKTLKKKNLFSQVNLEMLVTLTTKRRLKISMSSTTDSVNKELNREITQRILRIDSGLLLS